MFDRNILRGEKKGQVGAGSCAISKIAYGIVYLYTFLPACLLDFDGLDLCNYAKYTTYTMCLKMTHSNPRGFSTKKISPHVSESEIFWGKFYSPETPPNSLNSDIIKYGQCQYVLEIQIRNNLISAVVTRLFFWQRNDTQKKTAFGSQSSLGEKHL